VYVNPAAEAYRLEPSVPVKKWLRQHRNDFDVSDLDDLAGQYGEEALVGELDSYLRAAHRTSYADTQINDWIGKHDDPSDQEDLTTALRAALDSYQGAAGPRHTTEPRGDLAGRWKGVFNAAEDAHKIDMRSINQPAVASRDRWASVRVAAMGAHGLGAQSRLKAASRKAELETLFV
jgi:hypothetical protein